MMAFQTLRELVTHLIAVRVTGEPLDFDDMLNQLRAIPVTIRPRAKTVAESYERADEMPGANDTFWIDYAFCRRAITYDDYDRIFDIIKEQQLR